MVAVDGVAAGGQLVGVARRCDQRARAHSCSRPTALVSASSERSCWEHTSSARPGVLRLRHEWASRAAPRAALRTRSPRRPLPKQAADDGWGAGVGHGVEGRATDEGGQCEHKPFRISACTASSHDVILSSHFCRFRDFGMTNVDLNSLSIANADGPPQPLKDHRATSRDRQTVVLFKDLEAELIARIHESRFCSWLRCLLTSAPILRALAETRGVAIVVQRGGLPLRPDLGSRAGWSKRLRGLYDALPATLSRGDQGLNGTALHWMSSSTKYREIDAVRCVGNHNSERAPASPRAHHKFVVFLP
mgnify:CR=1 FL=1